MQPFRTSSLLLLAVAGCLAGDPALDTDDSALSVWQWTDDVQIPTQSSSYQVGLAPLGSNLHMVFTQSTGELATSRFDGSRWATRTALGTYADYGPALVNHNGRLVALYHARGQNRLLMTTSADGQSWTVPVNAGTTLGADTLLYAPAAVVHGGDVYVGYCRRTSAGDRVRIERLSAGVWTEAASYPTAFRCKHVAMGTLPDGRLDILWTMESNATGWWYLAEVAGLGRPSSSWPLVANPMKSKKPPSIATCNGVTHLVHGGDSTPSEIWWSFANSGRWFADIKVPNQSSDGGAAIGCLAGRRAIMVHNGGYPQLWWSEFVD